MYFLIALVLQATAPDAATAQTPAAQTTPAAATQTQASPTQTAAATPQTEIRCRWVTPTGQRLRERICESVEVIDDRQVISQDATNAMTANRGIGQ
jgi:hypothetical protein